METILCCILYFNKKPYDFNLRWIRLERFNFYIKFSFNQFSVILLQFSFYYIFKAVGLSFWKKIYIDIEEVDNCLNYSVLIINLQKYCTQDSELSTIAFHFDILFIAFFVFLKNKISNYHSGNSGFVRQIKRPDRFSLIC